MIITSGLGTAGIAALEVPAGVAVSLFFTLWDTSIQEQVAPAAVSRVSSYDFAASLGLMPLGMAVAGPLADGVGLQTTLVLMSGAGMLAALAWLAVPDVRRVRRGGPGDLPVVAARSSRRRSRRAASNPRRACSSGIPTACASSATRPRSKSARRGDPADSRVRPLPPLWRQTSNAWPGTAPAPLSAAERNAPAPRHGAPEHPSFTGEARGDRGVA